MQELWKPILGYEGYYEISNFGNVRSLDRRVRTKGNKYKIEKGKCKTLLMSNNGYLRVKLSKNGESRLFLVHRLVATAFIPIDDLTLQVNHIDGNKKNNHYSNLEWCTPKQNIKHAINSGLIKYNPIGYKAKHVMCIETGIEYLSSRDAEMKTGLWHRNIYNCAMGNRHTCGGYHWVFVV